MWKQIVVASLAVTLSNAGKQQTSRSYGTGGQKHSIAYGDSAYISTPIIGGHASSHSQYSGYIQDSPSQYNVIGGHGSSGYLSGTAGGSSSWSYVAVPTQMGSYVAQVPKGNVGKVNYHAQTPVVTVSKGNYGGAVPKVPQAPKIVPKGSYNSPPVQKQNAYMQPIVYRPTSQQHTSSGPAQAVPVYGHQQPQYQPKQPAYLGTTPNVVPGGYHTFHAVQAQAVNNAPVIQPRPQSQIHTLAPSYHIPVSRPEPSKPTVQISHSGSSTGIIPPIPPTYAHQGLAFAPTYQLLRPAPIYQNGHSHFQNLIPSTPEGTGKGSSSYNSNAKQPLVSHSLIGTVNSLPLEPPVVSYG